VLVAVAVDEDGRRQILAVELANRESRSSWRDFLSGLKGRGLAGVEFVVSDNQEGLKAAIREVLPETAWQRRYVDFLRNALDYVPRKVDDNCLQELRWSIALLVVLGGARVRPEGVVGRKNLGCERAAIIEPKSVPAAIGCSKQV
jgi:Transposase, Mutator family